MDFYREVALERTAGSVFRFFSQCETIILRDGVQELSRDLLLKIELFSNPNTLYVVRGTVERLAEMVGFAPPGCRSIVRAVDEALSNVMRHCYCGRLDQPIELYFRRLRRRSKGARKEGLEVLLCDCGPAVDRATLRGHTPVELRPGGLGLHLIRQAMDAVEYKRVGRINRLRLVKYLPRATVHPGP
jgi:serine/threonine-protein kinase RsbW